MTETLLSREKEFHRLNRELDNKAKELIKEIDLVVQSPCQAKPTFGISFPFQRRLSTAFDDFYAEYPLHDNTNENHEEALQYAVASNEVQPSKSDAVVKLLKAKIQMLSSELETTRDDLKKKSNYCKELEVENQKICETRDKLYSQNNSLKETIAKLEANIENLQTNLQEQSKENGSLKKEIDSLKKDLKLTNQQLSNIDLRFNRSLEENEKLRTSLKSNKAEEKELRNEMKKLKDKEKVVIRNLEKQKLEILQSFKKQILLVDNLKKQKGLLEASKQVHVTQEDVTKMLNWKVDNST